jgi:PAS domain S-box-containing protein
VEDQLRINEQRIRSIITNAPIILFAGDRNGDCTFSDGRALELLGLTPGEFVGRNVYTEYGGLPGLAEAYRRALAGERHTWTGEVGKAIFEVHFEPLRDGRGTVDGVLLVAVDETEQKHLENEILQISEREQHRIAQDLHDGLCQQLSGIGFMSEVLHRRLAGKSRKAAKEAAHIVKLLGAAVNDTRNIARGLHPVRNEPNGLMSALMEFAVTIQHLFDIRCEFVCPEPVLLEHSATATHLFRIAQEAVHNAIRHGDAKSVRIKLQRDDRQSTITLTIKDDGRGLPADSADGTGMGLRIMRYRSTIIGANLAIHRAGRRGTIVTCALPSRQPVSGGISAS